MTTSHVSSRRATSSSSTERATASTRVDDRNRRASRRATHAFLRRTSGSQPSRANEAHEALRIGARTWSCDYKSVAALLLKVVLEYIPRYGEQLADAVREWGYWVKEQVAADIGLLYPPDPDGAIPIAYLWARVVT